MSKIDFWSLIHSMCHPEAGDHADRLSAALAKLDEDEILSFAKYWYQFHQEAYTWNLWGAAYLMNGGCSDDGFIDFRSWLLLQGQSVYEAATKNPDSLADLDVEMDEASCECYPCQKAFEIATNSKAFSGAFEKKFGPSKVPAELGEGWDFEDKKEMTRRYPRLSKKMLDQ